MICGTDIVVLAGGLGTRLRGVLPDAPKIMAPIAGRPFLEHLLHWFREQGARRVLLGLGYRADSVLRYLESHTFPGLYIETIVESEPLGTAGAIAFARPMLASDPVLAVNGDTFMDADLNAFLTAHRMAGAEASLLAARVDCPGRYGRLVLNQDRVLRFEEKDPSALEPSWINAGYYLFRQSLLDRIARLSHGSLERDVLSALPPGSIHAFPIRGRFVDIGTPESLGSAEEVFRA
jgi:NDP-sugar pyrophosphorylase family protein